MPKLELEHWYTQVIWYWVLVLGLLAKSEGKLNRMTGSLMSKEISNECRQRKNELQNWGRMVTVRGRRSQ